MENLCPPRINGKLMSTKDICNQLLIQKLILSQHSLSRVCLQSTIFKDLSKTLFPRTGNSMTLKLGREYWGFRVYKVIINDDPELISTYSAARLNLFTYVLKWVILLPSHLMTMLGYKGQNKVLNSVFGSVNTSVSFITSQ